MNQKTQDEVDQLLYDATFEGYAPDKRRELISNFCQRGNISLMEYMQLLDAVNTHIKTGSYEGCIIWRNAAANPLPD
jgi:hypothetical protein